MNECYFLLHAFLLVGLILLTLKFGKEAIFSMFVLQMILGNLFVTKQVELFGFNVTCSDVYAIGSTFSLNLLQEYFGKNVAKKAVRSAFFILFSFLVMAQIHLLYIPNRFDEAHGAFDKILSSTPRIAISSFFVAFLTQRFNIALYSLGKKFFPESALLLHFGIIALITQLFDTVLFSFIGLYALVHSIVPIIFMSYLIKVCAIFCIAPFMSLAKKIGVT